MIICGDIHGNTRFIKKLARSNPNDIVIQVGDFGVGFLNKARYSSWPSNLHFIRGNHDKPSTCQKITGYLGDYGIVTFEGKTIFYAGGAASIDKAWRVEGISWWPDEELTFEQWNNCVALYEMNKDSIDIVISHDGPKSLVEQMTKAQGKDIFGQNDNTRNGLQTLLDIKQPAHWFFGHWHERYEDIIGKTAFTCLGEKDYVKL